MTCSFCGIYNRRDRVFCLRCNKRLPLPLSVGISAGDFASPGDTSALQALRATEPLPRVLSRFVAPDGRRLEDWLQRNATRIAPPSKLDTLIRACGEVLGLGALPEAFVAPFAQLNAFTAGVDESPLLVICAPLLNTLGYMEMEALVAHELAHVRSMHVLYHSLAESIATGVQFVTSSYAAGLLDLPVRMLLLSWYRESEISADRAASLVLGSSGAFESLMAKLASGARPGEGRAASVAELLQTHPTFEHRVRLAREYCASPEFRIGRAKVTVAAASGALVAVCRRCGVAMARTEMFCPNCGYSWS